jgi:hypothetical protein
MRIDGRMDGQTDIEKPIGAVLQLVFANSYKRVICVGFVVFTAVSFRIVVFYIATPHIVSIRGHNPEDNTLNKLL